jgi:hypothetical protein
MASVTRIASSVTATPTASRSVLQSVTFIPLYKATPTWGAEPIMSNNLGNERKVVRIDLENPEFKKADANGNDVTSKDDNYPRGQLVWFDATDKAGKTPVHMGVSAINKAHTTNAFTALGIVAEVFTDTRAITAGLPATGRRRPRVNSRRLALPVTFNGVDLVIGDEPHSGFAPGDFVYMCDAGGGKTKLARADELCPGKRIYVGVAHTAAERNTHHAELYVNPF